MKILLTGGAGFIGSRVARAYLAAGHQVVVVDNLSHGRAQQMPEGVRLHRLDIRDAEALAGVFALEGPDVVNHHAALVSVRESARFPEAYAAVNVEGTRNVVAAAAACRADKLILASSGGAIYGEPEQLPIPESHPLRPTSPYGASKALAEKAARASGLPWVVLRYGNVYGPGQRSDAQSGVIPAFATALLREKAPIFYGDGKQTRDYVYVDDVARANVLASEQGVEGIFNLGGGCEVELMTLYEQIAERLGVRLAPKILPANSFEVRRNALESSLAVAMLGWQAQTTLDAGLKQTLSRLQDLPQPGRKGVLPRSLPVKGI